MDKSNHHINVQGSQAPGFYWQTQSSPEKIAYLKKYVVGTTVLDIGCGEGWYTRFLKEQGFQVTPIDKVERITDSQSLGFINADATKLPFPDQAFDTTVMFDVLEHIPDEKAALSELIRVTRKRVILSVPSDADINLYNYGLCLLHHIDKTHVREYSPETLRQQLESVGFTVVDIYLSKARHMPLVVQEFFQPTPFYQPLKWITLLWLRILIRLGIIVNEVASDIFCVADKQ